MSEITVETGELPVCVNCQFKHAVGLLHHVDPSMEKEKYDKTIELINEIGSGLMMTSQEIEDFIRVYQLEHKVEDVLTVARDLRHKIMEGSDKRFDAMDKAGLLEEVEEEVNNPSKNPYKHWRTPKLEAELEACRKLKAWNVEGLKKKGLPQEQRGLFEMGIERYDLCISQIESVLNKRLKKKRSSGDNPGNPNGDSSARWIAKWEKERAKYKRLNKPISRLKDRIISHKSSLILGREFGEDPDAYIERRGLTEYMNWKDYEQWEENPGNPVPKDCVFGREQVKPKGYFDPDSFRTICPECPEGRCANCPPELTCATRIVIGCKKGEFVKGRCQIGTETHTIYHGTPDRHHVLHHSNPNPEEVTIIHRLEDNPGNPGNPDGNPDMREIERELAERGIIF